MSEIIGLGNLFQEAAERFLREHYPEDHEKLAEMGVFPAVEYREVTREEMDDWASGAAENPYLEELRRRNDVFAQWSQDVYGTSGLTSAQGNLLDMIYMAAATETAKGDPTVETRVMRLYGKASSLLERHPPYNSDDDRIRAIAKAKAEGKDGVVFRDMRDGGRKSDHYAIFDPMAVKSAAPVTYDDKGEIIPLSKRFSGGTADIRYSYAGRGAVTDDTAQRRNLTAEERKKTPPDLGDGKTVFADDAGEVRYSARKAKDYTYEALVGKPDMRVVTLGTTVPESRAAIVEQAKKNAAAVGKRNSDGSVSVYVKDVGRDVILGTDGLKHGLARNVSKNALATVSAGEIISNSIIVNEMEPKKQNASNSYVLIGMARSPDGSPYVVRSVVNSFSNELVSMDVLYAINAKRTEPAALHAPRSAEHLLSVTDSTISIANLLDYVNRYFPDILPEDVLRHYGHESRPHGDLSGSVRYSERRAPTGKEKQQRRTIENLRKLLKVQGVITEGKIPDRNTVSKAAGKIIEYSGVTGKTGS